MSNFSGGGGGGLPAGGLVGQALITQSAIPGDVGWQYPQSGLPTILVPVLLGQGVVFGNVVNAFVTAQDSPAGATILIAGMQTAGNIVSVTDGTANNYVPVDNGGGLDCCSFQCENALHVPVGNTITVTFTNGSNTTVAAISLPGVKAASLDVSNKNVNCGGFAGGATTVIASGALAQPNEILIGLSGSSFRRSGGVNIPTGWTSIVDVPSGGGNDVFINAAYFMVYDKSSRNFQATFNLGCDWAADLLSFKGL